VTDAIHIRPIEVGELDALLALCREHARYEGAEFTASGQQERWQKALFSARPALYCWLALDDDRPCGFMTVTVEYATWMAERFAHMDCLYLREPYRRIGLGRAFIEALEEFCARHDCRSAQWQTPPTNDLGIRFYESLGARALPKLRYSYEIRVGVPAC